MGLPRNERWRLVGFLAIAIGACSPGPPPPTASAIPTAAPSVTAAASPTASPSASPTQRCREVLGQVVPDQYTSPVVGREVPLSVLLPPCYPQDGIAYPALYLLHGKPFDERHWLSLGLADALDRRWPSSKPGMVVILPRVPEPLFSQSDGGPGSYEQEFLEAVVPHVEGQYQVGRSPAERKLGGISRGGVWALEIGLRHPELFSLVAGISPSLSVNYARPQYDPFTLAADSSELNGQLFLLAGETDWARAETERLADLAREAGGEVRLVVVEGDHSDSTWAGALDRILDGIGD